MDDHVPGARLDSIGNLSVYLSRRDIGNEGRLAINGDAHTIQHSGGMVAFEIGKGPASGCGGEVCTIDLDPCARGNHLATSEIPGGDHAAF